MYLRRSLLVALLTAALTAAVPALSPASQVLLRFGDTYSTQAGQVVHRGADVACGDGDGVQSPVDGVVTFVGRLPGSSSAGIKAVTIGSGQQLITLSPLASANVEKGETVSEGTEIGVVADSGDDSSGPTHVHVSLRRNGAYLDPSGLIPALFPASSATSQPAPEADAGAVPSGTDSAPCVSSGSGASRTGALPQGVSLAPSGQGAEPARPTATTAEGVLEAARGADAISIADGPATGVGGAQIADGVSLPLQRPSATPAEGASISRGLRQIAQVLRAGMGGLIRALEWVASRPLALIALLSTVASAALLLSRRALERRLSSEAPVSDRLETLLQHAVAGAKLCGLTSCSGLLPSQSRGRLAQRR